MASRFSSLWQKAKKPLEIIIITAVCLSVVVLAVLIVLAYIFHMNVPGLSGKNLWDWLQLLIIPAVLAIGGYLFNFATSRTEREIASDRQREEALQAYIDNMSALLLEKNLRKSVEDDEVRKIGRVRTLTVLRRLDEARKGIVLQFLYESGLIDKGRKIIDLDGANLSKADLLFAELSKADLSRANLIEANLGNTNLIEADLSSAILYQANLYQANLFGASLYKANLHLANLGYAHLEGADLTGADLFGADLRGAIVTTEQLDKAASLFKATVPDGTKHT